MAPRVSTESLSKIIRIYKAHTDYYPLSKVFRSRWSNGGTFQEMLKDDMSRSRLHAKDPHGDPYEKAFVELMDTNADTFAGVNIYVERILKAGTGFEDSFGHWDVVGSRGEARFHGHLTLVDATNIAEYFPLLDFHIEGLVEDTIGYYRLDAREDPPRMKSFIAVKKAVSETSEPSSSDAHLDPLVTHCGVLQRDPALRILWDQVRAAHAKCEASEKLLGTLSKIKAAEHAVDAINACLELLRAKQRTWLTFGKTRLKEMTKEEVLAEKEEGSLFRDLVADKKALEAFVQKSKRFGTTKDRPRPLVRSRKISHDWNLQYKSIERRLSSPPEIMARAGAGNSQRRKTVRKVDKGKGKDPGEQSIIKRRRALKVIYILGCINIFYESRADSKNKDNEQRVPNTRAGSKSRLEGYVKRESAALGNDKAQNSYYTDQAEQASPIPSASEKSGLGVIRPVHAGSEQTSLDPSHDLGSANKLKSESEDDKKELHLPFIQQTQGVQDKPLKQEETVMNGSLKLFRILRKTVKEKGNTQLHISEGQVSLAEAKQTAESLIDLHADSLRDMQEILGVIVEQMRENRHPFLKSSQ
ncbi:MAG: hypothetical protein M4579_003389 [Chaenotheca gracillima]|nr:MAG: hypothetical protein M4579_003389 [Chaenotheca gracillima]